MNTLEDRLTIEGNIEVCQELLEKLYQERENIIKRCFHDIRIIGLERNEEFFFYETKSYCLICGKQFQNTRIVPQVTRKPSVITMLDYPNLNAKWGNKYREEIEKIYLSINKKSQLCSEKEIYIKLKSQLQELEESCGK